jgi:hypothetical protein
MNRCFRRNFGKMQVLRKHSDTLLNPKFGMLGMAAFPSTFLSSFVPPLISWMEEAFSLVLLIAWPAAWLGMGDVLASWGRLRPVIALALARSAVTAVTSSVMLCRDRQIDSGRQTMTEDSAVLRSAARLASVAVSTSLLRCLLARVLVAAYRAVLTGLRCCWGTLKCFDYVLATTNESRGSPIDMKALFQPKERRFGYFHFKGPLRAVAL